MRCETGLESFFDRISISQIGRVAFPGTGFDEPGTSTGKNPGLTSLIVNWN